MRDTERTAWTKKAEKRETERQNKLVSEKKTNHPPYLPDLPNMSFEEERDTSHTEISEKETQKHVDIRRR